MKRDRLSFLVGFMPALSMAFMLGFEYLVENQWVGRVAYVVALAEILPFLVPFLFILLIFRITGARPSVRLGGFTRHAVPFVLLISLTAAALSFLLNAGVGLLARGAPQPQIQYAESLESAGAAVLLVVLLPSVFEELLFRGGILAAFEGRGTLAAVVISALSFALIHGNPNNLVGPFAAGLIYGYLTYALGSVWPAIFAHAVNNGVYLLISHMTRAYGTLGIWPYFILALVFVFGLLLYLSMGSLEKLVRRGKVRRFRAGGLRGLALGALFTPGLWLLALMYIIKVAYL